MFTLSSEDQRAIQQLFQDYGEAWGRSDAAACAALYASDGDAFAIDGNILKGPDEVRAYYEEHLTGKYSDLTMSDLALDPPRGLGQDTALMNGSWQLHGFRTPEGEPEPVQVLATFVMRKSEEGWRYVAMRLMVPFQGQT